jgi:hypothetical protein
VVDRYYILWLDIGNNFRGNLEKSCAIETSDIGGVLRWRQLKA